MELSEFIFNLKDLLKDACGKQAVSRLIQFPLICDFFQIPENLQICKNEFGPDAILWSPINICKIAAGITLEKEPLNGEGICSKNKENILASPNKNQSMIMISSLKEIYPIAESIVLQNQKEPWKNILDHYFQNLELVRDPKKSFETLLSIVFELTDEKMGFIEALFDYSDKVSGVKILAQMIMMNEMIFEMLINSSKQIFPKISENNFVKLIQEMQFLGNQTNCSELCKKFLEYHSFNIKNSAENEELEFHDELSYLLHLKNSIAILQAAGNIEEIKATSTLANKTLVSLEKKLRFPIALETETLITAFSKKTQTNASFSNQLYAPQGSKLFQEIKRIRNLSQTDPESAKAIAKEVYKDLIIENNLAKSIYSKDFGFLINPEEVIQIFIDLGLILQANVISMLLIAEWPQNILMLRKIALFASDYGNHKAAVEYFSKLDIISELSREERIKFASSLEYLDQWKNAFEVRRKINATSEYDIVDSAICAYKAGNFEALKSELANLKLIDLSNAIIKIFEEIIQANQSQVSISEEKISSINFSKDESQKGILLAADILQETGAFDKAIHILNKYVENHSFTHSILNRLYDVYISAGDSSQSLKILNESIEIGCDDQKSFEIFIDNLINEGYTRKAEQLFNENTNKWELSPLKINLYAKTFIEEGKYKKAEEILLPLVQVDNSDTNIIFNYCLAQLECSHSNFPAGIQLKNIQITDTLKKLVSKINKRNIFVDILDAELNPQNRLEKYHKLLQKYSEENTKETWRLFAGLGKAYFDQEQFDSAIINIKKALGTMPHIEGLLLQLIQSYANLKLWNEIENLLNSNLFLGKSINNQDFKWLSTHSNSSEWSKFLESQTQKYSDNEIYKILLSNSLLAQGRKEEAADILKGLFKSLNLDSEFYPICIQLLIDSDEIALAERFVEIFLSNKKSLEKSDFISAAFLYDQLGKSEKSLSILNRLKLNNSALTLFKIKLLDDLGRQELAEELINKVIEKDHPEDEDLLDISVKFPKIVELAQENPSQIFLYAAQIQLKRRNIDGALLILDKAVVQFPEDQNIVFYLIELLHRVGKNDEINQILVGNKKTKKEILLPLLNCLLGEIALSNKEEILCAQYLTAAMNIDPDNPRVKALQVRMLAINGNVNEAKDIFEEICKEINTTEEKKISKTISNFTAHEGLWLGQTACDLGEFHLAIQFAQKEIEALGHFAPTIRLFLSALASLSEKEFIKGELKIINHLNPINDMELHTFNSISGFVSQELNNDPEINNLLNRCHLFMGQKIDSNCTERFLKESKYLNSRIYMIYKEKGYEAAEIVFNSLQTIPENELFLAILEKDDFPQKALLHLKNALKVNSSDASMYALLAILEKNLGNLSEAYAAICLALEEWPEEIQWQQMAGDFCKDMGDVYHSISHYEKAQQLKFSSRLERASASQNLTIESETTIPILEEQLLQNPDWEQHIQLGKIFLSLGNIRKAIKSFESAEKLNPQNPYPYYWLAETALKLNNPEKALINIEKALVKNGSDIELISKKIEILERINKYDLAFKFLDEKSALEDSSRADLQLLKSKLIAKKQGIDAALIFLNSIKDLRQKPELLIEKARLDSQKGDLETSETIAEQLLNQDKVKPQALELLGSIAKVRGELDRAIDFYIKAIEMDPFTADNFSQLAEIYHDRKDFRNAIDSLENGIKANPGNYRLLLNAGLYYYQQGQFSDAEKRIKEAIKIEPDHADAKEILKLLENVNKIKFESLAAEPV
jgi:tetratricopeptide (TPR) repeat protein